VTLDRSVAPSFQKLREELFRGDLTAGLGDSESDREASGLAVHGVVIEIGTRERVIFVFGLRDGTASVYWSSGGGLVGGRDHPHINSAAKALVAAARDIVEMVPRVDESPLPQPGRVRVSILTSDGIRAGEDDEASLMAGRGVLYPLFLRGNDIVGGYRILGSGSPALPTGAAAGEYQGEAAYVMCLLTALARGHQRSVSLFEASALPDPAALTHDVRDLEWFASLSLDLQRLSAGGIIAFFYKRAGFRELPREQIESRIRIPLQTYDDVARKPFDFRVTQQASEGRFGIEIALLQD
jgi:hypothetical protein